MYNVYDMVWYYVMLHIQWPQTTAAHPSGTQWTLVERHPRQNANTNQISSIIIYVQ